MSQERDPRYDPRFCEVSRQFHRDLQSLVLRFVEQGGAIIPEAHVRKTVVEALAAATEAMEDMDFEESLS